jgi:hypothetical protein
MEDERARVSPSSFRLHPSALSSSAWLTAGQRLQGLWSRDRLRMAAGDAVRHRPVRGLRARPGVDGRPGWLRSAPWRTRLNLRTKTTLPTPTHLRPYRAISAGWVRDCNSTVPNWEKVGRNCWGIPLPVERPRLRGAFASAPGPITPPLPIQLDPFSDDEVFGRQLARVTLSATTKCSCKAGGC